MRTVGLILPPEEPAYICIAVRTTRAKRLLQSISKTSILILQKV